MFEMRSPLDAVQSDATEDLPEPELQEYTMERQKTLDDEANFRIRAYEFGNPDKLISLEYFEEYADAIDMFTDLCGNDDLVNAYGRFITVELCKSYLTEGAVHWEVVWQQMMYPSK